MVGRFRGNGDALDVLGEVAVGGGEVPPGDADDAVDRANLPKLIQLLTAQNYVVVVAGFVLQAEFDNAAGGGIRVWIDEHGIDDAENGAGGANTDREREDGGEREVWAPAEFADEK